MEENSDKNADAAADENAAGDAQDNAAGDVGDDAWKKDLPEQFQADTPQEALGKAIEGWKGARNAMREGVPEKSEDYGALALSDTVKNAYGEIPDEDPIWQKTRDHAREAGISKDALHKFLPALMEDMAASGLAPDALDPDAEIDALGGADKATTRRDTLNAWMDGMVSQDKFTEGEVREAQLIMATANGVALIEKMRAMTKETGIDTSGDGSSAGGMSEEKIREMRADPRYRTSSAAHDPDYRADVDAKAKAFFDKRA